MVMAAPTTAGSQQMREGSISHIALATREASEHPEVLAWLAEAKRLFAEAQERFETGKVLPALSSLAAVPPLHRMLVERCSELLDADGADDAAEEAPPPGGLYL